MSPVVFKSCVTPQDADAVSAFFHSVWAGGPEVIPMDLLLAMLHVDAYCEFAVTGDKVVAASAGFRGLYNGEHVLHSHVTASRMPGLGYQLKLRQRDWARERAIPFITWTFDPLVRRNGFFNIVKLAALGVEYSPNFYGTMLDDINAGHDSDRITAVWDVNSVRSPSEHQPQWHTAISIANNAPVNHGLQHGIENLVHLPQDIEVIRQQSNDLLKQWREETRSILYPALESGWTITGMANQEAYIITPPKDGS